LSSLREDPATQPLAETVDEARLAFAIVTLLVRQRFIVALKLQAELR